MSKRSYSGSPHAATTEWKIEFSEDSEKYYVTVPDKCDCGCPKCEGIVYRPHSNGIFFDEHEEAVEWMEGVQSFLDEDYEDYCNENSYAINQMERYEQFRNEY